jgi:pimeloyl-ACP methyl ester carboxylesterase
MDQVADLADITAPTLVIAGAEDPAAPPAHGELIAATIPGARFTIVPGVAHLATYERPDILDPLIEKAITDG